MSGSIELVRALTEYIQLAVQAGWVKGVSDLFFCMNGMPAVFLLASQMMVQFDRIDPAIISEELLSLRRYFWQLPGSLPVAGQCYIQVRNPDP